MSVLANDLVWDGTHNLIYLSVPSADGPGGNVIMAINPTTGATVATQFAGSEPDALAISDDDQYLYVSLDGAASVQRFLLPDLTPDITFQLGRTSITGPNYAVDLQVAPATPHTLAVSSGGLFNSSHTANSGLAIFDDATPRSNQADAGDYGSLQWGLDSNTLYAADDRTTGEDFYVLAVNADGVQQSQDYTSAFASCFYCRIHYDAGTQLIYGDEGSVLNPASGQKVGSYPIASVGAMTPDSANNTAYFVTSPKSNVYQLQSFNQNTFAAIANTTLTNVSTAPVRLIHWGTQGLAFNTAQGVYLTGSTGSTAGTMPGAVPAGAATIGAVAVGANDIVWDSAHGLIYASVQGSSGTNAHSIVAIDPTTGAIAGTQSVGSEASSLAISDDDQFLYAGLNSSGSVQRLVLPGLTPDINFSLGSDSAGIYYALDLQVAPGSPHTLAVDLGAQASPAGAGVAIFDDATERPTALGSGTATYDSIQWGANASALYAADNELGSYDFFVLAVNSSGVQQTADYSNAFYTFDSAIHFDQTTGLVYDDDGLTANPANGLPAGLFNASGIMVPDGSIDTAFFLGQLTSQSGTQNYVIESFDMGYYRPIAYIALQNVSGTPERLIRWGSNGLAFCTSTSVYIIQGAFVGNSPPSTTSSARLMAPVRRTWTRSLRMSNPLDRLLEPPQ